MAIRNDSTPVDNRNTVKALSLTILLTPKYYSFLPDCNIPL